MKQRKMLHYTTTQLKQLFKQELSDVYQLAQDSSDLCEFKAAMADYIMRRPEYTEGRKQQLQRLLNYDGECVYEESTQQDVEVRTFSLLFSFLKDELEWTPAATDLFIDLYSLLRVAPEEKEVFPENKFSRAMNRWITGLNPVVRDEQKENKERMLHLLVQKVERRKSLHTSRRFDEGLSYEDKLSKVSEWWNDHKFQLSMAIRSPEELNRFLGNSLSAETMHLLDCAKKKGMPFFYTPYYLSLLSVQKMYDDASLRSYILYSPELVDTYGSITAWEREDAVIPGQPNAAGWLLPEGGNIHRRYPEVAILIPDTMGRACGGLCASCQRMYDFQSQRLNFNLDSLLPKESWSKKLTRLMHYFEEDTQLRDLLLTGGDALMSQNKTLHHILDAIVRMALRKRKANEQRPDGEKYAELQRIRLGSRLLAYLPMRIDDELIDILKECKQKANKAGITQLIVQTHFQTPLEITPEAERAIVRILSAGWTVTNQLVYNVAASRRGHTARLRKELNRMGVLTYYTFSVKGFQENYAVFTPISRSMQEQKEEKCRGTLSAEQVSQLHAAFTTGESKDKILPRFMREHKLPFLATDRSVLNLPGIGKSMTFCVVGINEVGKRILKFDFDETRKHSPLVEHLDSVYIIENKSIAAYLRQLEAMGESPDDYEGLWSYAEGRTEPCFPLYEYPPFAFQTTEKVNHL